MIARLAGSKMGELKVRDMEALEFRPIELLEEVAAVFVHLHAGSLASESNSTFVFAMIGMGQYDPAVYAKAVRILSCKFHLHLRTPLVRAGLLDNASLGAVVLRS